MSRRRPFVSHKNAVLVESGTFMGDGIQEALNSGFERVISYEVQKQLYNNAVSRFSNDMRVRIFNKSSVNMWEEIQYINKPITFWLDGHFSSGITGYDEK